MQIPLVLGEFAVREENSETTELVCTLYCKGDGRHLTGFAVSVYVESLTTGGVTMGGVVAGGGVVVVVVGGKLTGGVVVVLVVGGSVVPERASKWVCKI